MPPSAEECRFINMHDIVPGACVFNDNQHRQPFMEGSSFSLTGITVPPKALLDQWREQLGLTSLFKPIISTESHLVAAGLQARVRRLHITLARLGPTTIFLHGDGRPPEAVLDQHLIATQQFAGRLFDCAPDDPLIVEMMRDGEQPELIKRREQLHPLSMDEASVLLQALDSSSFQVALAV